MKNKHYCLSIFAELQKEKIAGNWENVSKQPQKKACHPLDTDNIHLIVTIKK